MRIGSWNDTEINMINDGLRIHKISDKADSLVLRAKSNNIAHDDIGKETYDKLVRQMMEIVKSPEDRGVGIAAPQVGINRRLVIVQRFDKEGEPFEVYPNLSIISYSEEKELGPEGCLSVDDARGDVLRSKEVVISYFNQELRSVVEEKISGFTAVIFQHEYDHLDGVLFIDRL